MTPGRIIADMIGAVEYRYANEDELQAAISEVLVDIPHEREVRLDSQNRVDLLVDGDIVVEVKVKSTGPQVWRQMARYALLDSVAELILVTTRSRHMPPVTGAGFDLSGKPVYVVWLSKQAL